MMHQSFTNTDFVGQANRAVVSSWHLAIQSACVLVGGRTLSRSLDTSE
jgi:hypothetical protein